MPLPVSHDCYMLLLCIYFSSMGFWYNFSLHLNRLISVRMMSFLFLLVMEFGELVSFSLKISMCSFP